VRVAWGAGGRGYWASRLRVRGGVGWGVSYDMGCSNTWSCRGRSHGVTLSLYGVRSGSTQFLCFFLLIRLPIYFYPSNGLFADIRMCTNTRLTVAYVLFSSFLMYIFYNCCALQYGMIYCKYFTIPTFSNRLSLPLLCKKNDLGIHSKNKTIRVCRWGII